MTSSYLAHFFMIKGFSTPSTDLYCIFAKSFVPAARTLLHCFLFLLVGYSKIITLRNQLIRISSCSFNLNHLVIRFVRSMGEKNKSLFNNRKKLMWAFLSTHVDPPPPIPCQESEHKVYPFPHANAIISDSSPKKF